MQGLAVCLRFAPGHKVSLRAENPTQRARASGAACSVSPRGTQIVLIDSTKPTMTKPSSLQAAKLFFVHLTLLALAGCGEGLGDATGSTCPPDSTLTYQSFGQAFMARLRSSRMTIASSVARADELGRGGVE